MTGAPEAAVYAEQLEWLLGQYLVSLDGLPAGMLGWAPAHGTNSAFAIAIHATAVTRVYALGFGCGLEVERDRSSEFDPPPPDQHAHQLSDLHYRVLDLVRELNRHVPRLTPADLDCRTLPAQHLWGTGTPTPISSREAIVEAVRHAAIHLGELRLTVEFADRERGAQ